jgi:hypothetical protein
VAKPSPPRIRTRRVTMTPRMNLPMGSLRKELLWQIERVGR